MDTTSPLSRARDTAPDSPGTAIIELRDVAKSYGAFNALSGVNLTVRAGEVTCILGDNGAGKSTLIKILSGLHPATSGDLLIDGAITHFRGPKDALDAGIATVYQDLAVVGSMPVWRNFFLGQELTTGPFGHLRAADMRRITREQLLEMGIDLPDIDVQVSRLSGGQRQVVAIARAIYFGARVVILDEPTAALGVKQSGMVLKFVADARDRGIAVILITHNPHHAYLVGDEFVVLGLGRQILAVNRANTSIDELALQMAGGGELNALEHELRRD
ncbi:ATP-binding cassette domain-containing protein [Corynebacterium sp. P7202]|uniref:ATP-binding cassette domain-containing protein n=1 Tax=Corynebacterium pygosceleis TaxID=2800406 RepID=A0A9Q4GJH0_9CORY|nr:ATP-binding cassette domain-containing protein [Corynebacterium pygosceleis]MCK7637532.1 ATP-binding cassette domain-containing protein [Corynebacterium pygosceleis]MCX7444939.1 ATP-binding cassette domain-containing protein [Corynebacterium pygosceleis]MCX7468139.1 ATP-binding cassette domain-containing protein [Corynebacterium pygosceleis]